jgi:hypothetical protein
LEGDPPILILNKEIHLSDIDRTIAVMDMDIPYRLIAVILIIAVIVGIVVQQLYHVPVYPRVGSEGFLGALRNSPGPKASPALPEAVLLLEFLNKSRGVGKNPEPGLGEAERRELELLIHKMTALLADLTSTDRTVNHTRHLPFETAHDRMVVGELCGMCLQQTVSARDLDLLFEAWRERGGVLLRKLCTVYGMSESDALFAEKQWMILWTKVYDIASVQCVKPLPLIALGPRDATPFEPENLRDTRSYDYRYGGLSASGWNGAV